MREMLGMVTILAATLVAVSGASLKWQGSVLSQVAFIIEVSCPDPEGCCSLLAKAIEQAPAGATLRLAPGTYYEKPLTIEKSLRLEGAPSESARSPRIVLVQVGTALRIRAGSPMTVELERVSIEALAQDPFSGEESVALEVFIKTSSNVQVTLKEVGIRSHQGIMIGGDQPGALVVEVIDTNILAGRGGIGMNLGRLILQGSTLRGPNSVLAALSTPFHGVFLQPIPSGRVEAVLTKNLIEGFSVGLWATASSHLGQGRVDLQGVENVIASNRQDGLYLLGDRVDAELNRNDIRENGGYGIRLALPDCTSVPREFRFQGVIRGTENEFFNNKSGNLCPPDYPWPPNFIKKP